MVSTQPSDDTVQEGQRYPPSLRPMIGQEGQGYPPSLPPMKGQEGQGYPAAFSCVLCNISCVSCSISSARIVLTAFSFGIYRQLRWLPRSRACSVAYPAMDGLRRGDQRWLPRSPKSKSFHHSIDYSTDIRLAVSHVAWARFLRAHI